MANNTSTLDGMAETLNKEMRNAVLPVTIFVGLEAVLGFFGNFIVLYVFLFRYHKCNFRYFVLSLAFVDITSSLTTIPGEMVTQLYWYIYPEPTICKVKSFFNMFTVVAEALCLLTISVDRYRKVCRPLGWQIRHRVALILCCVIFAVAFVMASPVPFLWGTHTNQEMFRGENVTVTVCAVEQIYVESSSPLTYTISVETLLSLSLFVMLFLYIFVARTLLTGRFRSKVRKMTARFRSKVRKMSPTLEVITVPSTKDQIEENKVEGNVREFEYSSNNGTDNKPSDNGTSVVNDTTRKNDAHLNDVILTLSDPKSNKTCLELNACSPSNAASTLQTTTKSNAETRIRRRTLIVVVLTVVFIVTTILYFILLSMIARSGDFLQELTHSEKAVYFFFFRLYFINHVINPVVYGLLDPQFRKVISSSHIS